MTVYPLKKKWHLLCLMIIFSLLFSLNSSINITSPSVMMESVKNTCEEFWVIWQRGEASGYHHEGHNFSRRIYWVNNQTISDLDKDYYQARIPSFGDYTVVRAGHMSLMRFNGTYYMADAFYDGRTYRRLIKCSSSGERHTYSTIVSYDSESYRPMNEFAHINESQAWLVTTKGDGNVIRKIFWKNNETWADNFDTLFNTGFGSQAFCPKIIINVSSNRIYCYYCRHTRAINPRSVYVRYSDNGGLNWSNQTICFDGYGPREHEPAVCLMNGKFYIFSDIKGSSFNVFRSDDGLLFTPIQNFNYTDTYILISHEMIPINDTDVLFLYTNWTKSGNNGYRGNWLEHRRLNESGMFELVAKFFLGDSACSGDGCIFANIEF